MRNNSNTGLNIETDENRKSIQISQFADDTTLLFFKTEEAMLKDLQIVEQYGKVSGLRLNNR